MIINEREFELKTAGEGGSLVIAAVGQETDCSRIFDMVKEKAAGKSFSIAFFKVTDWNMELSPWQAEGPFDDHFSGGGAETLKLLSEALPALKAECPGCSEVYLAGYSLAGLFALWALYSSELFDGCASCSGSMWFDGWLDHARDTGLDRPVSVYLSLGGKEEKTKDPVMASIGDATRAMEKLLKADPHVQRSTLEMNPGGHFSDPTGRLAKGIAWLITGQKH